MDKHIGLFPLFLNKIESCIEVIRYVLRFAIVQIEFNLLEFFRIFEAQIDCRTNSENFIYSELVEVVSKIVATDEDGSFGCCGRDSFLTLRIVILAPKHSRMFK